MWALLSLQHLQSDHHRAFVLDSSNYCVLDQLVAEMLPGFNPNPSQESEEFLNRCVLLLRKRPSLSNLRFHWPARLSSILVHVQTATYNSNFNICMFPS